MFLTESVAKHGKAGATATAGASGLLAFLQGLVSRDGAVTSIRPHPSVTIAWQQIWHLLHDRIKPLSELIIPRLQLGIVLLIVLSLTLPSC